jgi:RNase P/RNase MRP subunit p29
MLPEVCQSSVPGHSEPKRVKTWSRSQNQCYPSLIGLSYEVTVSQNESKHGQEAKINDTPGLIGLSYQVTVSQNESNHGQEAKINATRVLSAFRTRSQWAKSRQRTWSRSENQCCPSLIGLSYQVTESQNESKHGQEAKIMYLKFLLNRRHGTRLTCRDITQVLIYCRQRAGNIWSKDMLNLYVIHVFLTAAPYVRLSCTFF